MLVVLLGSLSIVSAEAQKFQKNIMTGGPKGTYTHIGHDLASISAGCGPALRVNESAGSLENLVAVTKQRNTQFGIVQSDMLEYVRTYSNNDPVLQQSVSGLRVMVPLYNEEIHVLASRKINRLADLAGKKVAIGKVDSGTFLTSSLVLDILQLEDAIRVKIGPAEALPLLLNGEIDALFFVSGVPTKLFSETSIDAANFHLLNISEPELLATYTATEIPGGTYPFQPDPVNVVAVRAILMTYDYRQDNSKYNRRSCRAVSNLSNAIFTNLEKLKETGHPKWRDVDFSQLPQGWKVSECAKAGMAVNYKPSCGSVSSAFATSGKTTKRKATITVTAGDVRKVFKVNTYRD